MVHVSELRVGDYIKADWLGSGWYKVLDVGRGYSGSGKVYLAIEGYGSIQLNADESVERQYR